ncbi:MAG: fumarylacetoacetate hydrolase family protein [Ruminococcaceae bacterium]|nr:fumarylacetoacetate hydrolase family protein [Oscillospiraceae bacterium]
MKIARYTYNGETHTGIIRDGMIYRLTGDIYSDDFSAVSDGIPMDCVKLEIPSVPTKIVAVGKNYSEHIKEMGGPVPETPILFIKPSSSLTAHEGDIVFPEASQRVDHEAELCFIVKKTAKKVKKENWKEYILGYSCLNDVTARDIQKKDGQWTRAKGYDTFAPFGPWMETEIDPNNVTVTARVNGEVRQCASTSLFLYNIGELLEFITDGMTLFAGDVVTTGTPSGISAMQKGDVVEVEVEGIGILRNYCK